MCVCVYRETERYSIYSILYSIFIYKYIYYGFWKVFYCFSIDLKVQESRAAIEEGLLPENINGLDETVAS